jgi:hypothetical protein
MPQKNDHYKSSDGKKSIKKKEQAKDLLLKIISKLILI